jgi:hypothetical protein
VLSRQHLPNGEHVMRARDRARERNVILLIDHYVPEPDRDAGSRTMLCIIRGLQRAGLVVKFWPHNLYFSPGYTEALQDIGVEVAYGGDADTFRLWLTENGDDLDHVLMCRPQVAAAFLPELKRHPGISLLYYGADLHFRRMRQEAKELGDRGVVREAVAMEKLERSVWRDVDVVLYPSDEETEIVRATEPGVAAMNRSSCSSAASRINRTVTVSDGSSNGSCRSSASACRPPGSPSPDRSRLRT